MDKKFCIFDMDGTLVDSMGYWKQLGREYLAQKGFTENVEPVLERIKTMTMAESTALIIRTFRLEVTPEELVDEMNQVMEEHYRRDVPLKSGIAGYLTALRERGARLCVATATDEVLARACLERLEVADCFEFILSCEAMGVGKDRPDVFLAAAHRLGAAPREIAVFEDAVYAVRSAKAAGFYTVGVYDENGAADWASVAELADETVLDWNQAK